MMRRLAGRNRAGGAGAVSLALLMLALLMPTLLTAARPALAKRQPLAAIVVDARTGRILYARNADAPRYPASITKVMTIYLLFRELKAGRLKPQSRLRVSRHAALRPPSKLWLKPGQTITVDQAIRALAVKSANDVATVVAENLAGTEAAFARRMTRMARALGMTRTTFRNASGLPRPANVSTARDLATLSLRLMRDFPGYYHKYFGLRYFVWRGRRHRNHNHLLGRVRGVDGIKTGYIRAAGYNLAASARRGGKRVVAVVLGAPSSRWRNRYMAQLIERAFRHHRLASGRRIAALAGTPPGWSANRAQAHADHDGKPPVKPRPRPAQVAARALAKAATAANDDRSVIATGRRAPRPKTGPRGIRHLVQKALREDPASARRKGEANRSAKLPKPASAKSAKAAGEIAPAAESQGASESAGARHAAATVESVPPADDDAPAGGGERIGRPLSVAVRVQVREADLSIAGAIPAVSVADTMKMEEKARTNQGDQDSESGVIVIGKTPPQAPAAGAERTGAGADAEETVSAPAAATAAAVTATPPAETDKGAQQEAQTAPKQPLVQIVMGDPARARRLMARRWLVQIGAFPTLEGARTYLRRARKLSRHVRGKQALIIRVEHNGRVFYRARYAGMTRKQARRACRELKRHGISCLPMAPGAE